MIDLEEEALWIIMDPWYPTPLEGDLIECPNIDELNQVVIDKIVNYIPKLKHVCISCPTFINDSELKITKKVTPHPQLNYLYNFGNQYNEALKYMKRNKLNSIVYCGFHYGECILTNSDGVIAFSHKYNVFVKRDLCGIFPGSISWEDADKLTKRYAKII
jgi:hypothetical protein